MTFVWMGLLALIAAVWLTRPIWRRRGDVAIRRRSLNVAGYQQRLAEIDNDVEVGAMSAVVADQLREEAAARLIDDAGDDGTASPQRHDEARGSWLLVLLLAVFVGVFAVFGYLRSDSRQIAGWIETARQDPAAAQTLVVDSMVARLEQRLRDQPDDAEGWAMLGRSYFVLERYADAAGAYGHANQLTTAGPEADWLASEGESRLFAQDDGAEGRARQLFEKALESDPALPKALWYAGLLASRAGEYGTALDRWLALRDQDLPADFRQVLEKRLPELAQLAGRELPVETPSDAAAVSTQTRLTVKVMLDDGVAQAVPADATLMVFARRPEGGPPLAVVRQPYAGPTEVVLDDSQAMIRGNNLSSAPRWEVTARISQSGGAQAQPGDLEGRISVTREAASAPQTLTIDRRVP